MGKASVRFGAAARGAMPDSVTLPRRGAPVETRNLSKSSENSCKKKKAVSRHGYQAPGSSRAIQERAARAPKNPLEAAMMAFSDRLPVGLRRGAQQAFGGIGAFFQRFLGG